MWRLRTYQDRSLSQFWADPAWAWEGRRQPWGGVRPGQLPVQQPQLQRPPLEHARWLCISSCLVRASAKAASRSWDCHWQPAFKHLRTGIMSLYVLQHKSYASFFIDFFKGCWRTYLKQTEKYVNHHIYHIYRFLKFWSRDRYPLSTCIHGSRPRCFTCIAEQVTSEVVDMFSRGGRPLACHFANASVEMTKFVRSAPKIIFS